MTEGNLRAFMRGELPDDGVDPMACSPDGEMPNPFAEMQDAIASLTAENAKLNEAIGGHIRHITNLRAMIGRLKRELYGDGPDIGDNPCPY